MLSGKAIARAVRAHFIVDTALNVLILRRVLNAPLPCQESKDDNNPHIAETADVGSQYLDEACTFYEKLMSGDNCAEEAYSSNVMEKIKDSLKKNAESVKKSSRIYQSRAYRKLGVTSAVYPSHASIHGSFWPQLLHQIWHAVFAADVEHPDSTS